MSKQDLLGGISGIGLGQRKVKTKLVWRSADQLTPGTKVVTKDGRIATVKSVKDVSTLSTVHNFAVEDHHTYFVGEGRGVWVHNTYDPESIAKDIARKISPGSRYYNKHRGRINNAIGDDLLALALRDHASFEQVGSILSKIDPEAYNIASAAFGRAVGRLEAARAVLADGTSARSDGVISQETGRDFQAFKAGSIVFRRSRGGSSSGFSSKVFAGLLLETAWGSPAGTLKGDPAKALDIFELALYDKSISGQSLGNIIDHIAGAPSRTRWEGFGRFVGSGIGAVATAVASAGAASTGFGAPAAVAGGAATVVQADSAVAGLRQMFSGRPEASGLAHALIAVGLTEEQALRVSTVTEVVAGFTTALNKVNHIRGSRLISRAQAIQTNGGQYAADAYTTVVLRKGDIVVGGLPGQGSFYTNQATLNASGLSRQRLFESLQVYKHPTRGHRPMVGIYEVQRTQRVATGTVRANLGAGPGGGTQYVIPNYGDILTEVSRQNLGN